MHFAANRIAIVTVAVLVLGSLSPNSSYALRSTTQESHTDPDYRGYKPKVVSLVVEVDDFEMRNIIEERVAKELESRAITVYIHDELFTPTRQWDDLQRGQIYEKYEIEAVIVVAEGVSSQQISQYGSQTWGTATATSYGNSATAYGHSTTTALVSAKSKASFSGLMFDVTENRTAWTTDIFTKASGTMIVGSKGDAKAAAKGIIEGLIENHHIPAKGSK